MTSAGCQASCDCLWWSGAATGNLNTVLQDRTVNDVLQIVKTYITEAVMTNKEGNRGDMRKIHVTRYICVASGPQSHFFEKTKKKVFTYSQFQYCFSFSQGMR